MYNQVVYNGYTGDGILPNPISSTILEKWNDDQITSTLLKDLFVLTTSLYHTSTAESDNPKLFRKVDLDTNDILASNTDNDPEDDDDNDQDDITTKTVSFPTKYQQERKELDKLDAMCKSSPIVQDTMENIKSYKSNQQDSADSIYVATEQDVDVLRATIQKHYNILSNYLLGDSGDSTSKDAIRSSNDQVPTAITRDETVLALKKQLDNGTTTTTTTTTNESPMIKRIKKKRTAHQESHVLTKRRGLENRGNDCYINSSLQFLFSDEELMEYLMKHKDGKPLITELCTLWQSLVADHTDVASAAILLSSIKNIIIRLTGKFTGAGQHDAHEFLTELIQNGNTEQPIIEKFFLWDVQDTLKCTKCTYSWYVWKYVHK